MTGNNTRFAVSAKRPFGVLADTPAIKITKGRSWAGRLYASYRFEYRDAGVTAEEQLINCPLSDQIALARAEART